MTDLKETIRQFALGKGIDLIGFARTDRFDEGDPANHPHRIYPDAKSVIGLGFRVLRGSYRGIEEGSTFYQYYTTGVETIEEVVIPQKLLMLAGLIEDLGYEAVVQKRIQTVMPDSKKTNPETEDSKIYKGINQELMLDFSRAAVCCGLGEPGLSGSILSDDFGPFQRFAFIITNADLAPDPVVAPHICDRCGLCLKACPGNAFEAQPAGRAIAGQVYPVHALDTWQCAVYYKGAHKATNPFIPPDALAGQPDREEILRGTKRLSAEEARAILDQLTYYPPGRHALVASICGRACDRACYAHLEEIGRLKRRFAEPFRKKEPWKIDE
ncbi:MAG: hypothetical protein SCM11_08830 [Bacillota bacterium]|nr:hypothetical protein [Bacillota bacterium]